MKCRRMRTRYKEEDLMKKHVKTAILMDGNTGNHGFMIVVIGCGILVILCIWAFIYFKYGCCLSFCYQNNKTRHDEFNYEYSPLRRVTRYNTM